MKVAVLPLTILLVTSAGARLGAEAGFLGTYHSDQNLDTPIFQRVDREIAFDWGAGAPDPRLGTDHFSVRWSGQLVPPTTGRYQFITASDDGVRLWIDDVLIIDDWSDHGTQENSAFVDLVVARAVTLRLEYYENGGDATCRLLWAPPERSREVLRDVEAPELPAPPENDPGGFAAEYFTGVAFNELIMERRDQVIDFDWGTGTPFERLGTDNFSVRWRASLAIPATGPYRFFTTSDDGVRLWVDSELVIEDWSDHSPTEHIASVEFVAGRVVPIQLEYYERGGGAVIRLEWEAPGQPREILEVLPPADLPDRFFRFSDAGVDIGNGKAAWGDFDNDGRVDLLAGGNIHRNVGDGFSFFTRVGDGIWGDYDNDGWLDIFVYESRSLFRNEEGRQFVNVTSQALPELPTRVTVGAAWADLDGDSFLDLYIGGFENPGYDVDVILLNEGGETFRLAWTQSGDVDPARGITACDFDEDFDMDVYVSNYRLEQNQLWRNDGNASFVNAGPSHGVEGIWDGWGHSHGHTIGSAWGDLDGDGHFDLFVGNFSHPDAWQDRPRFYRNLGPGEDYRFEDLSDGAGLAWQESFASPTLGDVDNDGDLDLYFTTVYRGDRNVIYVNQGGFRFTEQEDTGLPQGETYQAAWADFDNDGDLDLATNGRLYRNEGNDNDWIVLRLVGDGIDINRAAIGAQARVQVSAGTVTRQVESSTGEGNQNDLALHFGLGVVEEETVTVEIGWPNGIVQTRQVAVKQSTEIVYGVNRYVRGDINADSRIDVSDPVALLFWLFRGDPRPRCVASANADADSQVALTDAVYLLAHLFQDGPAPASPHPDCGESERASDEELGCEEPSCP